MVENSATGLSLFTLLARDWVLEDAVPETAFNFDDTAVAFRLESGKLALASTKDAESPKIRTRLDLETGRTTIRPRKNPVAPLLKPDVTAQRDLPIVRFGPQGFAVVDKQSTVQQVTAGGNVVVRLKPDDTPVTSVASSVSGDRLAVARGSRIVLYATGDMTALSEVVLDHPVACQALSPDGRILAAWGGKSLSLIDIQTPTAAPQVIECDGDITEISWQASGDHLSCASADKSIYIINRAAGTAQRVEGFPTPVRNTAFNEEGNALLASGAFRLVGWDSNDLPQNDQPGTPLFSGKPGLVAINVIAAHPKRSLVASGYANGLVTIASTGTADEMMLHQEKAAEVSGLCWSKTGEHLAIGFSTGKAAIVTFPEQMFK